MRYCLVITLLLLIGSAFADSGGPDLFGYLWADESESTVTFDWVAPDTMFVVAFPDSDDERAAIPLPFPVNFYGALYSDSVYISTNGLIAFSPEKVDAYLNGTIPQSDTTLPDAAVYVYWDDLRMRYDSRVYYQTEGTAPDRVLTITWNRIYVRNYYNDSEDPLYFQVSIYENSPSEPNSILLQYLDPVMSSLSYSKGRSATVGIENHIGTIALQYSCNTAALDSSRAILFYVPGTSTHDCIAYEILEPRSPVILGWPHPVEVVVGNRGSMDEPEVPVLVNIVSPIGDTVYRWTDTLSLDAGETDTLDFLGAPSVPYWTSEKEGIHTVLCRVNLDSDMIPSNDEVSDTVSVWRHISSGGPDTYGYTWKDFYHPDGPAYVSVPADLATPIGLTGDDGYMRIALPFTFPYYGENFDSVWVSTNGLLCFNSTVTSSYAINDTLPNTSPPQGGVIAPYWDDSDVNPSHDPLSSVRFLDEPATGSCWIIWNRIYVPQSYSGPTGKVTYGVRLFDDGIIEFHYLDAHSEGYPEDDYGRKATVGIESPNGTSGLVYEYNGWWPGNPLFDHFAIRFMPSSDPIIIHIPPENLYADVPGFCIHLLAQYNNFGRVVGESLYVTYPIVGATASDSAVDSTYHFTFCDVMPGDSVDYYFAGSDAFGARVTAGVGTFSTDVLNPHQGGPDSAGYKFVDSWAYWDTMSPSDSWFEINPDSGGPGTEIVFDANGLSDPIPFASSMPFYGITSYGVVVSEDGWLSMDTAMNLGPFATPPSTFPNTNMPNAIIAAMWTNLEQSLSGYTGGGAYYWHDYTNELLYVQWEMYPAEGVDSGLIRFQAVIADNPSRIRIVFDDISAADLDQSAVCTESESGLDGLAYWYNGEPVGAPIPASNSAVLFYNTLNAIAENIKRPEKLTLTVYPNPFNSAVVIAVSGLRSAVGAAPPRIEIFDINGRMVANVPVTGSESAEPSSTNTSSVCRWYPNESLSSGVYLARLKSGNRTLTRRLVMIK